ncbi:MAG: substrate-binding domain-containing protein [Acidaminobacter sp.]|uniref:LacI family DNA-binding transcriptional regulator n=1 Tax=Acidaminobacter sp. TaxID=1872102 RepID=UPI001380F51C|nr:LacI family DNA-binding transcriptional regulator [Acidaminobacter sp.]MZQ99549.1 substrate-binding domain-containing protein [Acidaminobacter sp.]
MVKAGTEKQRITSKDVARIAGVSQPTVSRVFSPASKVKPETRDKVMNAVLELGYKPNAIARSLTSQRTNIVGIVAQLNKDFSLYTLDLISRKLQTEGKQVLLFNVDTDQELDDVISKVLQYRVDGLIITVTTFTSKLVEDCARQGTQILLFNRHMMGLNINSVSSDNVEVGRMAANYLLDTGHKRLAYIGGRDKVSSSNDRLKGFRDRIQERGVDNPIVVYGGEYYYETGRKTAGQLLQRQDRPDAIFCSGDVLAFGAMDAARYDLGLNIPEDVSIIGFDDVTLASWPSYSLTTVRQPIVEMVDTGIEMLLKSIENCDFEPELKLFQGQLIERSTVRRL